jgi:hypothetical protein
MLTSSRRRFLSLIGSGATVAIVSPMIGVASTLTTAPRAPQGEIWMPPVLQHGGHFGRDAVLRRIADGLATNGGQAPAQWDSFRYWDQIADCLSRLSSSRLRPLINRFFSDVVHGDEHAAFASKLADASRLRAPRTGPSHQEVSILSEFLFDKAAAGVRVAEPDADHRGVDRFDLMLEVDVARALPLTGAEFDGEMVAAATGLHYAAFRGGLRRMAPFVATARRQLMPPHANVGDALMELLLGGIQSISYQDAIGRKTQAVLLADLLRRGYLLLGRDRADTLVFARIPTYTKEGEQ